MFSGRFEEQVTTMAHSHESFVVLLTFSREFQRNLRMLRWRMLEQSMMARLGGAIAAIALLSLLGMAVSSAVALSIHGSGEAINLAGSLRMQSWQMASLSLSREVGDPAENRRRLRAAVDAFDATLSAPSILTMLPGTGDTSLDGSYKAVSDAWRQRIRPQFRASVENTSAVAPGAVAAMLGDVGGFVADINLLVKQMETATASSIRAMQWVLGVALVVTVLVAMLAIRLIRGGLLKPLRELLSFAARVGQGDLSVRIAHTGEDELGRLGQACNLMADDLRKLYQDLESRVRWKTSELTRSNLSLELLYNTIARLHGDSPGQETYLAVLREIEAALGMGHAIICLGEPGGSQGQAIATTMQSGDANPCTRADCTWCHGPETQGISTLADGRQLLVLPLSDPEMQYGVLIVELSGGRPEAWQMQLLDALSRHIGVAIGAERRAIEKRRVALLEERAVIARELHDSLAQSLAYMKIQVSRLQAARRDPVPADGVDAVLTELREGLSSAYRQLRELLSTFRLKMEGENLRAVLAHTAEEFAGRGGFAVTLDIDAALGPLTPNEEIHLLHVIREALSNVVNHAMARAVHVRLTVDADGLVEAVVEDDGVGIHKAADVHHYGMTIMDERARSLQGEIHCRERSGGGTCVTLAFRPAARAAVVESLEVS
ncbi:MAG: histidine kinase [Sulfuritalea sp.]|nr:histidine kinase [Sulfuritalea sp.]